MKLTPLARLIDRSGGETDKAVEARAGDGRLCDGRHGRRGRLSAHVRTAASQAALCSFGGVLFVKRGVAGETVSAAPRPTLQLTPQSWAYVPGGSGSWGGGFGGWGGGAVVVGTAGRTEEEAGRRGEVIR